MNTPRIVIGSIIQESNTFSCQMSDMNDFARHSLHFGEEILNLQAESELLGFIQEAGRQGAELIPTLAANAISSGPFCREGLSELTDKLVECLREASSNRIDGVYFAMHGAMVSEGCSDVEGFLIEAIRSVIGDVPLVISLDLHGNVTRKMAEGTDGIVGFRTYPHMDFADTGRRAAKLLFSILRDGKRPVVRMCKIPMIVPAENSQSAHGPFAELWEEALLGEERGDSLVTSLFPVQPWLDVEEMGCAVVTVGHDAKRAEQEAERLAELFWQKRHSFRIRQYTVQDIAAFAEERAAGEAPIVISDSADSPGAGASGDSNVVLSGLISLGLHERYRCLLTIVDAPAVHAAITAGVGEVAELRLGYSLCPDGQPLSLSGRVRRIGDGRFTLQGGYASGTEAYMGRCVVFDIGKLSLLITERPTFSGDPAMYRSMGLMPEEADIVMVKSANQFRADYEKLSRRIYILDTPGRSPANVERLTYTSIQRPFFPFDDHFDWRNRA